MFKGRWNKMNKHRKRVFAAALAVAVAGTSFNVASLAVSADNSKDGRVIKSFEALEADVAYQYLPVGSYESEIVFPEELKVIVYSSDSEPEPSPEEPETPETPENPEPVPETPEEPEPAPETPEDPGEPEPVSENGNGEGTDDSTVPETGEADLSAAIKNAFGARTVYAAEGGEPGTEEPTDPEKPAPEDGEDPGTEPVDPAPVDPVPESPAPSEPENPDPEEPGDDNGQDPETDGQVSDNTPSPEDGTVEPEDPETQKEPEVIGGEEEKILTNVKWKLVRDLSAYRRFEALLEGDVFVYEPDISKYPLTSEADLPQIKVTITAKDGESVSENDADGSVSDNLPEDVAGYPEFSRMMISGGVRIKVEAPQGVFPEGAEISVKKIDDEASTEKIRSAVGASANVAAFDITVKDVSGNEIQPRTEYGLPVVTFENVNIVKESAASDGAGVSVYHFEDGFESPEKLAAEVDTFQGSAAVEAEHFSPFVVVVDGDDEEPAGDDEEDGTFEHPFTGDDEDLILNKILNLGKIKIYGYNTGAAVPGNKIFEVDQKIQDVVWCKPRHMVKQEYRIKYSVFDKEKEEYNIVKDLTYAEKEKEEIKVYLTLFGMPDGHVDITVYPKYLSYDYSTVIKPLTKQSEEYKKELSGTRPCDNMHNPNDPFTVSINLYKEINQTDLKDTVKEDDLIKVNLLHEEYVYYKVSGTGTDKDGDHILPNVPAATPATDTKYSYERISEEEVREPGIYAAVLKAKIPLNDIDEKKDPKLQVFKNTVIEAADSSKIFTLSESNKTSQGVFYQISKISIKEAIQKGVVSVNSGGGYQKAGYKIFTINDTTTQHPDPADAGEKVKYTVRDKDGKVFMSGYVEDDPVIKKPGTYTVSLDAIGATHFKGTYGTETLSITKRSLSSNQASVILDPKQFTVTEVSTEKPVKPPVKVIWKPQSGNEVVLEEGVDYTLEYFDNTKFGTGKVTVSGMGGYEGSKSENFDIIKGTKEPVVLYRGENETVSSDKPKAWYNSGVLFSGKPEGNLTYKAKLEEGVYGPETEPFRKEGEGVTAKIFLSSNNSTAYFVTRNVNIDLTAPEGNIVIGDETCKGLKNNGKIVSYVNKMDEVFAYGTDKLSGVTSYGLLLTESPAIKSLSTLQNMDDGEWRAYEGHDPIPLLENKNNFIYIKVRDKAGNAGFASAPGICYDTVPPVLGKVDATTVNGKLIAEFNASDSLSGVNKYYVLIQNMSAAAPTKDAILKGKSSEVSTIDLGAPQKGKVLYCVVTDKAGNVSDIVKVNPGGDSGSPKGSIAIMGKTWNSLQKQAKTVAYTREKQLIAITGSDDVSGIAKIEYMITPKFYSTTGDLSSLSANLWKTYNKEQQPEIEHNVLNYVYARITNNAGGICYISSEGICHDAIKPVVTKVAASKEKASSVTVTITGTDELSGIDSYYALAKKIDEGAPESKTVESSGKKSDTDTFDLTGLTAATNYKVYGIIKDKAGNLSEVKYQSIATKKAASSNSSSKKDSKSDSSKKNSGDKKNSSKTNANAKDKNKNGASANGAGAGTGSGSANGVSGNGSGASGAPFIEDASSGIATGEQLTSGWDRIGGESVKAAEPSEIFVQMNGETVVPADLLKNIAKKNITIHFEMNDDLLWTINGLSFTADPESDIDLSVRKDTRNIPSKLIDNVADISPHTTISLGYNGDFGFKAVLSVPLDSEYAGMTAGRYYYNETANKLDYVDMAPISNQGRCEFDFTHASDYLIVVMPGSVEENMQLIANSGPGSGDLPGGDDKIIKPKMDLRAFFSWDNKNLWILVVSLMSLVLCGVVLFAPEKRRKLA